MLLGSLRREISERAFEIDDAICDRNDIEISRLVTELACLIDGIETHQLIERAQLASVLGSTRIPDPERRPSRVPNAPAAPVASTPVTQDAYVDYREQLREHLTDCGNHIRELFDYAAEAWETICKAAEWGDVLTIVTELDELRTVGEKAEMAHSTWQATVCEVYDGDGGGGLGIAGEALDMMSEWHGKFTG